MSLTQVLIDFIFLLKEKRFSSCLIVSGKEFQAIVALCLHERRPWIFPPFPLQINSRVTDVTEM